MTPVAVELLLGYHPCSTGLLTSRREPAVGQCQTGSLTGAVASERVSEAPKGSLRMDGNHSKSAKAEGSLTATPTGGAGNQHLHWYFNFTGCIVETALKSLRLSCGRCV